VFTSGRQVAQPAKSTRIPNRLFIHEVFLNIACWK
jgi:hypothetical protein